MKVGKEEEFVVEILLEDPMDIEMKIKIRMKKLEPIKTRKETIPTILEWPNNGEKRGRGRFGWGNEKGGFHGAYFQCGEGYWAYMFP